MVSRIQQAPMDWSALQLAQEQSTCIRTFWSDKQIVHTTLYSVSKKDHLHSHQTLFGRFREVWIFPHEVFHNCQQLSSQQWELTVRNYSVKFAARRLSMPENIRQQTIYGVIFNSPCCCTVRHYYSAASWVQKVGAIGAEVVIFGQTGCKFWQRTLWVLQILILPLNSSKMGDFSPKLCILNEHFPTGRKFSDRLKFRGKHLPSLLPPPLSRRHCYYCSRAWFTTWCCRSLCQYCS